VYLKNIFLKILKADQKISCENIKESANLDFGKMQNNSGRKIRQTFRLVAR